MVKAVYIHIPFCSSICTYCDFAKMYYDKKWINNYLDSLSNEIDDRYKNEIVDTIYIGGGTPSSLDIDEITKLFKIINKINKSNTCEITFECNIENIDQDKLLLLYQYGVNRLSIGVQTFNDKFIKFLGRKHTKEEVFDKIDLIKKIGFKNINIDLMYAFPGQTLDDLKEDLDNILKLGLTHISTYSLIIEPNTVIYNKKIKNIDEDLDADMYNLISNTLNKYSYQHYETSNYSLKGYNSKHNLVYWNNEEYYGFGLGASGYINNVRYTNTRNMDKYLEHNYIDDSHQLDKNETIENEFILGLRKLSGINKDYFNKKYMMNINSFNNVKKLIEEKKLIDNGEYIFINPKMIYISNSILVDFIGENYG